MHQAQQPDKNRFLAVLRGEKPDRVPNFEVLVENPTLEAVMGRPIGANHTLANIDPHDYMEFVRRIGQDVIGMCFYGGPFHWVDERGQVRHPDFRIGTRADLRRLVTMGPELFEDRFHMLGQYERAVEGTSIGLFALLGSILTSAYDSLFGFENFMFLLHDDPGLIEDVLERHTVFYEGVAQRLVKHKLSFLYVGDDIAYKMGLLFDPVLMRRMWLPRIRRIMAPALSRGIPVLFHSDGNIEEVLPDLVESGVGAINPIEPYGMDIRKVRRRFGRRLGLVGNLDVGGALSQGTPQEVRAEARRLIDDVGREGGLVLASCHSITANVRPENFWAMVQTAWEAAL